MNKDDKTTFDLYRLEEKIDDLITKVTALTEENEQLRGQKESLTNERFSLLEKTDQAKKRVEAMILRLKTMETK
jgi:cell division protein ZapB|tara:strand:- start:152 stop:373 length:222 start_codon:yes stop_codon:yes gene_type:complete